VEGTVGREGEWREREDGGEKETEGRRRRRGEGDGGKKETEGRRRRRGEGDGGEKETESERRLSAGSFIYGFFLFLFHFMCPRFFLILDLRILLRPLSKAG
jgi:hypothetical protein